MSRKNEQPFYHRATLLFTATRPIGESELQAVLSRKIAEAFPATLVADSVVVEECDAEAGDPADLT